MNESSGESKLLIMDPIYKEKQTNIPLDRLRDYSNHPFKMYSGEKLEELIESIKANGILQPILVRHVIDEPDIYEIISGHNRVLAAKEAGMLSIPAIIKNISNDEADFLVTEANFQQRKDFLPSELGHAFNMRLSALTKLNGQGKRNDLTSVQLEQKSSREEVASIFGKSPSDIQRHIRLTYLISELQDAVDNKQIPFGAGVNVSYLRKSEQIILYQILSTDKTKISIAISKKLKSERMTLDKANILDDLTEDQIRCILSSDENDKIAVHKNINVPFETISQFFDDKKLTEQEIQDTIIKALEYYRRNH